MPGGTFMIRRSMVVIASIILVVALAACSNDDASDDTQPVDDPTPTTEADEPDQTPTPKPDPATPTPEPTPTPEFDAIAALQELSIDLEFVADGFIQPTALVPATDGTNRLFVLSRHGIIHVLEDGTVREEPFLDIQDRVTHEMVEQGLLSMALHPEFAENRYFYVNYTDLHGNTMISRFKVSEDGERAIRESETPILPIEQPHYSHNGGNLKFGPDGYLYIGMGDGEDPGDPHGNAQDASTLLGAMLRIDVDGGDPYGIPPDNPFVDDEYKRDEVWAIGLRNPWRYSFHPQTGDLYIVDVGQWAVEEINVQPADSTGGENYGWPIMEGDQCWEADECDKEGLTMPVVTYSNPEDGCAIIGGHHYFGKKFPEMHGVFIFGDWCSGNIWGMVEQDGEYHHELLLESDLMINAFGLDQDGEIYVLDFDSGSVFQIVVNR
jgi:glucose/arabinose dehydrogenase